jgi:hypothetical protein
MRPIHRVILRFAFAITGATAFGLATAATPAVPAFVAHYELLRNGSTIGKATLTLAPQGNGTWSFVTTSKGTAGLAGLLGISSREVSVFQWTGGLPQCDSYDFKLDTGLKTKHRTVRCDWNRHVITVHDKIDYTYATQPGTLERHTVPLALAAGLAAGQRTFDLPVAVRDRIETQHYVAADPVSVRVPAGTFDAIRVTRTGGSNAFEAWFAPGKLPVPVKIDQGGKNDLALVLESWSATPKP